jgi:hypothetical protein
MSALIDITREDLVIALDEARARFLLADAALKSFQFSCPARGGDFDKWKELRESWDQRDEELQTAREDLKDFDKGNLSLSDPQA